MLNFPTLWRKMFFSYHQSYSWSVIFSALKYSTAVPVIFLSALKYHVMPESWTSFYRPLWLFSSVINSLYSFYWDVTRDWDLSGFTKIFKFSRPSTISNLLYGRQWVRFSFQWNRHSVFFVLWCLNLSSIVAGIFLGDREQSGAKMRVDIQIISTFEAQLHNGVHNDSDGDVETISMGIFQSREWVEQDH
jgi:hypothetical protein